MRFTLHSYRVKTIFSCVNLVDLTNLIDHHFCSLNLANYQKSCTQNVVNCQMNWLRKRTNSINVFSTNKILEKNEGDTLSVSSYEESIDTANMELRSLVSTLFVIFSGK